MPSIIKNPMVFDETYIPPQLHVRDKEAEFLLKRYMMKLSTSTSSSDITLIYGSIGRVGIGKTTLAKYVGNKLKEFAYTRGINFAVAYVNLYTVPSILEILTVLASQVAPKLSVRGSSPLEALKAIVDTLYRRDLYLLVILDEFQQLIKSPRVDEEQLYILLRIHEQVPSPDNTSRINYLLVAQDFTVLSYLKEKLPQVESQIGLRLHLKPYTTEELYTILEQRAQQGLYPGVWDPDLLWTIAEFYGVDGNGRPEGSARKAIIALRIAAETAEAMGEHRITEEHVRFALSQDAVANINEAQLRSLQKHELLLLLAVAMLSRDKKSYATTGEVREKYEYLARIYGENPRGHTQFNLYMRKLDAIGLIEAKPSGKGMRGRTTLLRLAPEIPAQHLVELLEKILMS